MKELQPGDLIAGKFRLERVVGRGGMGSVWAARHEQLGMLVALKFIEAAEGFDLADARARFEREARAAAQIRSPHVAQILDHGVDGDRPFIAMELLEGEDLGERLRREGCISLPAAAKILSQAAKALRRAHEAGIIHRDLKPGNVFIARFDDDEVVKILDFGVAKVRVTGAIDGPMATQTGIVFGSPSYMSPEQARGVRTLDHRSDLWSLAVIMFRAITGVKPFQAASIGDLVIKLCIDPLPVATSFAPDLPPEIDRFFERAFAREPDKRFQTAVELAAALETIAAGAAPAPRVPPPPPSFAAPPSLPTPSPIALAPIPPPPVGSTVPMPSPAPAARVPAQQLPPAPPLTAPMPPAAPVPVASAPSPGSGPHVAFAPGTLTPPPGVAPPVEPIPPPAGSSMGTGGWRMDAPPASVRAPADSDAATRIAPPPAPVAAPPPAPVAALAAPPPVQTVPVPMPPAPRPPAPSVSAARLVPPAEPVARPSQPRLVIGAALGAAAFVLLAIVLVVARSGSSAGPAVAAAATSTDPIATSTASPVPATADPVPAPPSASASTSASASASAAPSAEPTPSVEASAGAEPDPSAKPRSPTKAGKRRPNFGY